MSPAPVLPPLAAPPGVRPAPSEYNLAIGEHRARAARDSLVSRGVRADRITTLSYGEEHPVCTESAEACWQLNRRAEFRRRPD
ncbi:MAG: OmpA family protein [Candidatus Rokubacteria bacterium]|nr:OmpA family protein [Candidatus Rokubacteria bacterium]